MLRAAGGDNAYQFDCEPFGTSLDGLDIAFCEFEKVEGKWSYRIIKAETVAYSREWKSRLSGVEKGSA